MYNTKNKTLETLYMHESPMNCVGASINESRCLLGTSARLLAINRIIITHSIQSI